jgi:hypothetical protein
VSDDSYKAWMRQVDAIVLRRAGVSVHDLPDFQSRDMYNDEVTPAEAAAEVLAEAGF